MFYELLNGFPSDTLEMVLLKYAVVFVVVVAVVGGLVWGGAMMVMS